MPLDPLNEQLMKLYHIHQVQFLPVGRDTVWEFFSNPENLEEITPPAMRFRILSISLRKPIYAGQMIHYRIRIIPFVWVSWLTEITIVKDKEYFIDDQRSGPYAIWHHQHHFKEVNGGIEMRDAITYAIPFGWLGRLANRVFVRNQLSSIFKYRRSVLEQKFGKDVRENLAA